MNKITTILAAAALSALALTGCSAGAPAITDPASVQEVKTVSLNGTWTGHSTSGNGPDFEADVTGNAIKVFIVSDGTKGLFWDGDFSYDGTKDSFEISSTGNRETLDSSLFGSNETVKKFTYKDSHLSFDFSVMGVFMTIDTTKE